MAHTPCREKAITGYPDHIVTDDGRVFSGSRELTQHPNFDGYPSVFLKNGNSRKHKKVHSLVAGEFLPPRPTPAHQLRHIDGSKTNNHWTNLAWGTAKDNADDRARHGRTSSGPKHSEAIKRGKRLAETRAAIACSQGE